MLVLWLQLLASRHYRLEGKDEVHSKIKWGKYFYSTTIVGLVFPKGAAENKKLYSHAQMVNKYVAKFDTVNPFNLVSL